MLIESEGMSLGYESGKGSALESDNLDENNPWDNDDYMGSPPAGPDATKKIYDDAFAAAVASGDLKPFMKNKEAVENALIKQLVKKQGYAYEDANYVLDQAQQHGFARLPESKRAVKLSSPQLRKLIESIVKESEDPTGVSWDSGLDEEEKYPMDSPSNPSSNSAVSEIIEELVAAVVDHYDTIHKLNDETIDSLHSEIHNAIIDAIDNVDPSGGF